MKNKKLVRIGAMLVLVVMVAMLAVPALADHDTSEGQNYIVSTKNKGVLNLRTGPSKAYRNGALKIPNNALITLYEFVNNGQWAEVEYNGNIGYVMTQFIRPV